MCRPHRDQAQIGHMCRFCRLLGTQGQALHKARIPQPRPRKALVAAASPCPGPYALLQARLPERAVGQSLRQVTRGMEQRSLPVVRESADSGMPDARKPHRPNVGLGSQADSDGCPQLRPLLGVKQT